MKYKIFLVLLLCWAVQPLLAQQTKSLTLQEAVNLAIANSRQLKGQHAKITETVAALREAEERKLPDVTFSGSYLYLPINPNVDLKVKTGGSGSGGSAPSNSEIKVSQAAYGIASVSLPIYTGGRIRYGIESAGYLEKAAELDSVNDRGSISLNTIQAFSNLFKSKASIAIVQESLKQSRQRDTDYTNLEKNGLLARNDLLKASLQTANIELSLLDAQKNWRLANVNMNIMLGLPETTELILSIDSLPAIGDLKTIQEYEQLALINRKDVGALDFRIKAAGTAIKSAKAENNPSIALTGGYIAADIPGLLTITNAVNIGVGVNYSLSSLWKTKSKVQQAEARQQQLAANEEMLTDNIRSQINQAYENYLLAVKRITVLDKSVLQADENYRIVQNKYNNTLATTTEVLEAEVAQLQARLNDRLAKADSMVSYAALLQAAGLLNEQSLK